MAEAARKCVDATGVKINWDVQEAGIDVMPAWARSRRGDGKRQADAVRLKAPITTPVGTGFRSINVYLRQALGLFACIRPCNTIQGVRTFSDTPVDLVIVRENTEDLYAGVEFEAGKPETEQFINGINARDRKNQDGQRKTGVSIKPISFRGPEDCPLCVRLRPEERPQKGDQRPQGQHHEVLRRPVVLTRRGRRPGLRAKFEQPTGPRRQTRSALPGGQVTIPRSPSRIGSSTTCACSWCKSPRL